MAVLAAGWLALEEIERMDKKETYLYGTLLALIQDNLKALEKHRQGKLGVWGRARASSRNGAIDKFIQKIIDYKSKCGQDDPIEDMDRDLSYIRQDTEVWDDISDEQLDMVRKLIKGS
jgi:hypothetical protein